MADTRAALDIQALVAGASPTDDVVALELASARRALGLLRRRIPAEYMESLLAEDLAQADTQWRAWSESSTGNWKAEDVQFVVTGMSADKFLAWWGGALNDLHGIIYPGYPEHYRFGWVPDPRGGDQPCFLVIEEVGHAPFRMYCSYGPEWAVSPSTPGFDPVTVGVGRLRDGTEAVRFFNEIKATPDGFVLKLGFYVGVAVPPAVVAAHVEQQLVEWTLWLRMAAAATDSTSALALS